MTDLEWKTCDDPGPMLEHFERTFPDDLQRPRRFAVACVRRIWPLLTDERVRKAIERSLMGFAYHHGAQPAEAPIDSETWTAEGEPEKAALAATRAVYAEDARETAEQCARAVQLCLREWMERAVRHALTEVRQPERLARIRAAHFSNLAEECMDDTWTPAWNEVWSHPPAIMTAEEVQDLEKRLRTEDGESFRQLVHNWLTDNRNVSPERLEATLLHIARREADNAMLRERAAQAELLRISHEATHEIQPIRDYSDFYRFTSELRNLEHQDDKTPAEQDRLRKMYQALDVYKAWIPATVTEPSILLRYQLNYVKGVSTDWAAAVTRVPVARIRAIMQGEPASEDEALALSQYFDTTPDAFLE